MIYNSTADKEEIRKCFRVLLAEHNMTLLKFCRKFKLKYSAIYDMVNRNHINHDSMETLIHKLDSTKHLFRNNGKLIISKKF